MPPCVRMRPSSTTVSPPGPTCFQPVRSLPLKSCCHLSGSPLQTFSSAANASAARPRNTKTQTMKRFNIGNLLDEGFLGQTNLLAPALGINGGKEWVGGRSQVTDLECVIPSEADLPAERGISPKWSLAREIPRATGESAALRDDARECRDPSLYEALERL